MGEQRLYTNVLSLETLIKQSKQSVLNKYNFYVSKLFHRLGP